jgi:hypothetical protein
MVLQLNGLLVWGVRGTPDRSSSRSLGLESSYAVAVGLPVAGRTVCRKLHSTLLN